MHLHDALIRVVAQLSKARPKLVSSRPVWGLLVRGSSSSSPVWHTQRSLSPRQERSRASTAAPSGSTAGPSVLSWRSVAASAAPLAVVALVPPPRCGASGAALRVAYRWYWAAAAVSAAASAFALSALAAAATAEGVPQPVVGLRVRVRVMVMVRVGVGAGSRFGLGFVLGLASGSGLGGQGQGHT